MSAITPDAAFSKVLELVRAVESGMQSIDSDHGLSGSQLWALWQISAHPGIRVGELASTMHIHQSTASNLLDKLEVRDLVRRVRQDADNRAVGLILTKNGEKLVRKQPGPLQGRLRNALASLPQELLDSLFLALEQSLEAIRQSDG